MAMRLPLRIIGLHALALLAILALGAGSLAAQPPKPPITWSVPSTVVTVAAGGTIRAELSVKIDEGWHLYSLTQTPPPDPTRIVVPDGQAVTLGGKIDAPVPESGFDKAQGSDTEYYTEAVTFRVPLLVARATAPGKQVAHVKATWQACSGSICLRPQTVTLDVPLQVTAAK